MYTRWGMFEEAINILPEDNNGWVGLNHAFCLDALGERQEAVAIYKKLKDCGHDSIAEWAQLGLERPTWPHNLVVNAEPGESQLKPQPSWQASASSSSAETTAQAAIDGDRLVCWANGGAPDGSGQIPGQWFQLDFGKQVDLSRLVLDHYGVCTFYTNNWPRGIKASYTADGTNWLPVDISQAGPMTLSTISFRQPTLVRSIRFELTQQHDPEWWSIHEIYVFSSKE
jgi:tetratricopeptide (TPR) repeat protein